MALLFLTRDHVNSVVVTTKKVFLIAWIITTEIVIDFDSNHVLKKDKVIKWTYKNAKAISFQTPIVLCIHIKEQSEGDLFFLCTDIQREQVIITKLSEPEEGNNLIKILQKKLPDMIEKKY